MVNLQVFGIVRVQSVPSSVTVGIRDNGIYGTGKIESVHDCALAAEAGNSKFMSTTGFVPGTEVSA